MPITNTNTQVGEKELTHPNSLKNQEFHVLYAFLMGFPDAQIQRRSLGVADCWSCFMMSSFLIWSMTYLLLLFFA